MKIVRVALGIALLTIAIADFRWAIRTAHAQQSQPKPDMRPEDQLYMTFGTTDSMKIVDRGALSAWIEAHCVAVIPSSTASTHTPLCEALRAKGLECTEDADLVVGQTLKLRCDSGKGKP